MPEKKLQETELADKIRKSPDERREQDPNWRDTTALIRRYFQRNAISTNRASSTRS